MMRISINSRFFAAVLCDLLWFFRNKAYRDGLLFHGLFISDIINKISSEHIAAWVRVPATIPIQKEAWISLPTSWFKINFDTAIRKSHSAQAALCRNQKGHIIQMVSEINLPCSPNLGEAMAARLATSLASFLNLKKVIFEGDSQMVVSAMFQPHLNQDWRISPLINNIIDSIPNDLHWKVRKINRSANFCTHSVARWAAARMFSGRIPISLYPSIVRGKFSSFHSSFSFLN
ncbi:hypothetical protein SLA2020_337860 [Shorea laevis]